MSSSRKLLQFNFFHDQNHHTAPPPDSTTPNNNTLDSNIVMVLAFIVCATVCSIGLHFLITCIIKSCLRSETETSSSSPPPPVVKRGVKKSDLKSFKVVKYSEDLGLGLDSECVICLAEFSNQESVRILPKCNHGFHVGCIDKWLKSNSSCPKCRNCLVDTCKKLTGATSTGGCIDQGVSVVNVSVVVPLDIQT